MMRITVVGALLLTVSGAAGAAKLKTLRVAPAGAEFHTIQDAVNAAPAAAGAVIRIAPGTYREVVHVDKPGIQFRGETKDPAKVVLVYGNSAASTCGTSCSPTLFVTGKDFVMTEMTVENDYAKHSNVPSQAVAMKVTGDRAVFRHVRLLGAQDTLYAASDHCMNGDAGPCHPSRQYFSDCYVEGHVDFIFGDSKAVFDHCEIHAIPHAAGGYYTAQSNTRPGQAGGYVFNHCRLTADPAVAAGSYYLGRPWRDYATVIYLDTEMGPQVNAAGWSAWKNAPTDRLKTATYAEFRSTGVGANPAGREPNSKQLSAAEAARYETKAFLAGDDGWDPTRVK